MHEFVGQDDSERFVAHDVACAPDRVAKAQRLLLTDEDSVTRSKARAFERRHILAAFALRRFEFERHVEMVLDRILPATGDEDHLLDACFDGFIDGILDQGAVDDR
ncbi:hypothetical protein SPH9361_01330 [Sphingobium sp. CECT 9361]|nr:hypothetical protein SPH9361_01330 [Sphingobium sp. CECT 9361]